jgi:membrane protein DedA with SNARE-associated domain
LPVRVAMGFAFNSSLAAHFSTELPMYLTFGAGGGAVLPLLFGAGVEYFMGRSLGLSFLTKLGPSFDLRENGQTQLAFEALLGVVYRI